MRRIVSNTGPLISLEKLNQGHDFIRRLYDKLIISPAVLEEVAAGQFPTSEAQDKLSELLRAGRINQKIYDVLLASLPKV